MTIGFSFDNNKGFDDNFEAFLDATNLPTACCEPPDNSP